MSKTQRKKHIVLWVLVILIIGIGILAFWQMENIKAFLQSRLTVVEIEQQMAENDSRLEKFHVRDLTDEEKQALKDGTKTSEEVLEDLLDDQEKSQYELDLSKLIAEIYLLRAVYNGELERMMEQAKEEYRSKTDSERSKTELIKWAKTYVADATKLEKECDAKMNVIIEAMTALIKENDGDKSIIKEVLSTYAKEKSLKKSWYLAQMRERGLLG